MYILSWGNDEVYVKLKQWSNLNVSRCKQEIKTRERRGAYIEVWEISLYGNHEIIEREQGLRKVKWNRKGWYTNKDRRQVYFNIYVRLPL